MREDFLKTRGLLLYFNNNGVFQVILLCLCLITALRGQDAKDKITFVNGDVSSGTVQDMDAGHVVFLGQLTGRLTYSWQDIKSLDLASSSGRTTFANKKFDSAISTKIIHHGVRSAPVVATDATSSPSDGSVVSHWSGTLSSQDAVTRATQDTYQVGGSLHLAYETTAQNGWGNQIIQLDSKATFGEASKAKSSPVRTALFEGTLSYSLYTVKSFLAENSPNAYNSNSFTAIADGYHNLSLGIDTQQSYGTGWAWSRTVKGKANKNGDQLEQRLSLQGDIRYSQLRLYAPGMTSNLAGAGVKESYALSAPLPFGTKKMGFSEGILVIPYFNDPRSLQIRGMTNLMIALTKDQRLQLGPQVFDDFFRNAPLGSKENYLQPSLVLTYCFNPASACK